MTAMLVASGVLLTVVCTRVAAQARVRTVAEPSRTRAHPARSTSPGSAAWARALASAGVEGSPGRWRRVALGSILALAVGASMRAGPGGGLAVVLVASGALALALRAARGRGPRRADSRVPGLLEHTARGLRSGLDLVPALDAAGAAVGGIHGPEARAVAERVDRGAPLTSALQPWIEAHPRPAIRLSVAALEVAAEAGGSRARALDGLAATLRSRAVVADEADALAAQARASAAVMVGLPVVVAAIGSAADPRLAHTLLGTPIGLGCVATATLLDGVGAWWMQRVVDGAHR